MDLEFSGSTSCVALLQPSRPHQLALTVINVGDSRAVLGRRKLADPGTRTQSLPQPLPKGYKNTHTHTHTHTHKPNQQKKLNQHNQNQSPSPTWGPSSSRLPTSWPLFLLFRVRPAQRGGFLLGAGADYGPQAGQRTGTLPYRGAQRCSLWRDRRQRIERQREGDRGREGKREEEEEARAPLSFYRPHRSPAGLYQPLTAGLVAGSQRARARRLPRLWRLKRQQYR